MIHQPPELHIILYQPEIPPNTGNIIRLCANTGCQLHLIKPFGFLLDEKKLKRAGLDYHEWTKTLIHESIDQIFDQKKIKRIFACSTKASTTYTTIDYQPGDALLFGPETRGLSLDIQQHKRISGRIRIPMQSNSRSLNLANSVAVIAYEALRQFDFPGLE